MLNMVEQKTISMHLLLRLLRTSKLISRLTSTTWVDTTTHGVFSILLKSSRRAPSNAALSFRLNLL